MPAQTATFKNGTQGQEGAGSKARRAKVERLASAPRARPECERADYPHAQLRENVRDGRPLWRLRPRHFARDQLSDSGKLARFPRETREFPEWSTMRLREGAGSLLRRTPATATPLGAKKAGKRAAEAARRAIALEREVWVDGECRGGRRKGEGDCRPPPFAHLDAFVWAPPRLCLFWYCGVPVSNLCAVREICVYCLART